MSESISATFTRVLSEGFVYNNPNDTYSPSIYVHYGHMISGEQFGTDRAYVQRAAYGAAGLFVLGFLALFLLDCGLLWRCCCKCCKCLTDGDDPKYKRKKCCNYAWFYILCVLVIIFDMFVFYGNMKVTGGVNTTKDSIASLRTMVGNINGDSYFLEQDGKDLINDLNDIQQTCNADFSDLISSVNSFEDSIGSLEKLTKYIMKGMDYITGKMDLYAVKYRMIGMWVLWGLSILSVLLLLLAHCCKSVVSVQLSMFFAQFTYFIYLVLGVIWCLTFTVLSDFCMQPTATLLRIAPKGTAENMVNYFATCNGSSAINQYANESYSSLQQAEVYLNYTESNCPNEASQFDSARNEIRSMEHGFNDIYANMECPPIQAVWLDFFNNGLCGDFHTGMFFIWGSQLITSLLLFCLILTAAYMHQYYHDHGSVVPTDGDGDDEMDEIPHQGEDGENDFVADYNRKKAEVHNRHGGQGSSKTHDVVGKNHRLPHQVQIQDDDESFFV